MMRSKDGFFDESLEQSRVKTAIVTTYFRSWARVMKGAMHRYSTVSDKRLAYVDLFAGPGRYDDGTPSTPLLVLEEATQDPEIAEMLITLFNDKDANHCASLRANIAAFQPAAKLKHEPIVTNLEVGNMIVRELEEMHLPPTLLFVDPWGYKGLTLALIGSVLKRWGCDCILFFNYNRINAGLSNPAVREHMDALFGDSRAEQLRVLLEPLSPREREATIVEGITEALYELGGRYVLPFCFRDGKEQRTSHHLIFVTKNFKGLDIMKSVMAGESSSREQNVASFTYCRATKTQPRLFELNRPLDELGQLLCVEYAGKSVPVRKLYEEHSPRRPFTSSNYKAVLKRLEAQALITVEPPANQRKHVKGEVTLKDEAVVTFPPRRS